MLPRPAAVEATAALAAAGGTIALAGASGGFFPVSWNVGALVAAWLALLGLLLARPVRPGRHGLVLLGAFVAVETWTAVSAVWSASLSSSFLEAERTLLYVLVVAAVVVVAPRVPLAAPTAGVLVGALVVCCWDLVVGGGGAAHRGFSTEAPPVGYANSLALLAAMGTLLALGFALARRPVALLGLVAFLPVLVQQRSNGSWGALAAGLVVLAALRLRLRAVVVVALTLAAATAFAAAALAEARGHERGEYWSVGARAVSERPLLGSGAGTYALSWLRLRREGIDTLDAHSLYLETLDELGPVGLLLLLAVALVPLGAALRLRGSPVAAGGGAAFAAWALGAGVDFHWEMSGVSVPALVVGAALAVAADDAGPIVSRRARVMAGSVVAVAAATAALALLGNEAVAHARDALARGDYAAALRGASDARKWQPWSPQPWELAGFARLAAGNRRAAAADFVRAARQEPRDPRLWVQVAQSTTGEPRRRALARLARLNPLYFGS